MKREHFEKLLASVRQMKAIKAGKMKPGRVWRYRANEVKALRERLKLSQHEFADLFQVSVWTLRGWEQGRREPEGPAASLLKVIEKEPRVVLKALHG